MYTKIIQNILIENQFTEFIGKEYITNSLKIFKNTIIASFLPFNIIKIKDLSEQGNKKRPILNDNDRKSTKIIFRLNFELKKKFVLNFNYNNYFGHFTIEIETGKKFFFCLTKSTNKSLFLETDVFSITCCYETLGLRNFSNTNQYVRENSGFSRCYFYLRKIYPYHMVKEVEIFSGLKFIREVFFHPISVFVSNSSGCIIWLPISFNEKRFELLQICNFRISGFKKFKFSFSPLNCSFYLSLISNSSLSIYRSFFNNEKKFLRIENLSKWEDSLVNSLSEIFWHLNIHIYLIGGFVDGKIFIWNEFLIPIIQFINPSFSIFNFGLEETFFGFIFLLKKNTLNIRNYGKKKLLKFLPQTIIAQVNLSKCKKTGNLNKEWSLMKNMNWDNFKKNFPNFSKFSNYKTMDYKIFLKVNRIYIDSIDYLILKLPTFKNLFNLGFLTDTFFKKNLIKVFRNQKILFSFKFIVNIIGIRRYLTRQEIEKEQCITRSNSKKFAYIRCDICVRIWKVMFNSIKNHFCPFCHFLGDFYSFDKLQIYIHEFGDWSRSEVFQKKQAKFFFPFAKQSRGRIFNFNKLVQRTMSLGCF